MWTGGPLPDRHRHLPMSRDGLYQIKQVLTARAAAGNVPISGAFELTPRCNFACKMCYVRLTPEQMAPIGRERTAEQWLQLGRQAREAGLVFLLLTGGEPFLRPDFEEIYRGLTELGLSISINTNGSLLNQRLHSLFRQLPPAMVNVTLYGASEEDYRTLCGCGGGFEAALSALDFFLELGVTVNLNTTLTPWNLQRYDAIRAIGADRGLRTRAAIYNFPPVRREDCPDYSRFSAEQAGELLARDVLRNGGADRVRQLAARLGTKDEVPMACSMEPGDPMACYAGRSQFWITWDGRMLPCGMLNEPQARPFEDGFPTAWRQIVERTAAISLCPDCKSCPIKGTCTNCAAVTSTETGSFSGRPDYMCRVNQSYRDWLRRLAETE